MEVVPPRDDSPDSPLDAAVNLDGDRDGADILVLTEIGAVERRDGDVVPGNKRRPEVRVLVALVNGRDDGVVGDLLVMVGGVDVEVVVVDSDAAVGVVGGDGDLDGGGEDVGGGDVVVEDGGVLEDEVGLPGLENGPDEEDEEEDDEDETGQTAAQSLD
ncbi:unnamed protein product [Cuscuta europaea]|uniref:Uncharacterized protein n=1 Tax=Cuscuta europaea TaxID=41803 RepID=A0A9P0YYU6_CUSEU|nr:unnamed protein product [Cuscuta europaea]